jgi:hypothetical protein
MIGTNPAVSSLNSSGRDQHSLDLPVIVIAISRYHCAKRMTCSRKWLICKWSEMYSEIGDCDPLYCRNSV